MNAFNVFSKGIIRENPVLRLLLGFCPVLAVTTTAVNGVGMGLATLFVLFWSNIVISLISSFIPDKVRIPCFIVVIATFVTIVDLLIRAFFPELNKSLGIFIPLIVVNCIILGRAEAFASKNGLFYSILDALGMGLGFTLSLVILSSIREILGNWSIFGISIVSDQIPPILLFVLPPGAFLTLGLMIATVVVIEKRGKVANGGAQDERNLGCDGRCDLCK
ncbi:MAG TPA: electron transport complex subunit E [Syntrophales bacterium]|nr:electron transport complex subunit E [Syntrophales bacterium]HPQ44495.1 electron transport complex subunit E [Syntrophales bacterium]